MGRNPQWLVEQRRNEILSYLSMHPYSNVEDLVYEFDYSAATIRRDINELRKLNRVVRSSGGKYTLAEEIVLDKSFYKRYSKNHAEKVAIAREAIKLVEDGHSIGIDCSTTSLEFSKLLLERDHITVVTNNLLVPQNLFNHSSIHLFCVGGFVSLEKYSTEGSTAYNEIERHNFDLTFFSVTGLDFKTGLSSNYKEFDAQLALVKQANKNILLLDSSKLGVRAAHNFMSLKDVDLLIVDSGITQAQEKALNDLGVEYIIAHI